MNMELFNRIFECRLNCYTPIFAILVLWVKSVQLSETDNTISFIGDFLKLQRKVAPPAIVTAFLCWKPEQNHALHRFLSDSSVSISMHFIAEKYDIPQYHIQNIDGYKTFILDLDCENANKIIYQANDMNMFRGQNRWLLLKKSFDYNVTNTYFDNSADVPATSSTKMEYEIDNTTLNILSRMFINISILIDSDVTVASRVSPTKICLHELYRRGPLEDTVINNIGLWGDNSGIQLIAPIVVARRRFNLHQTTLNAVVVVTEEETINHLDDGVDKATDTFSKLSYVQYMEIFAMINASYNVIVTRSWGNLRNGSWDGLTGYLARNEADIGLTPLFMLKERLPVVHYIAATVPELPLFIFRKPPLSLVKNIFSLPFSDSVWIASGLLLFIMCIILYGIFKWEAWTANKSGKVGKNLNREGKKMMKMASLSDVILISLSTMCEQGAEIEAEKPTGRIVTLLQYISVMFLYTAYSACIVALLQSTTDSIRTLKDLYDSGMKLGVWDTPYNRHYFPIATDPVKKAIYHNRVSPPGGPQRFLSMEEGVEKVRQGLFAFHTISTSYRIIAATFEEEEKCGLEEMIYFDDQFATHMAVRKHSPFKEIISLAFRQLHESGVQVKLLREYFPKKPMCEGSGAYFLNVGISDCSPVMLIFAYGIASSVLILALEIFVHRVPFFIFRKPPLSVLKNIFTLPFSQSVWLASGLLLFVVCIILYGIFIWEVWTTNKSEKDAKFLNHKGERKIKMVTLSDAILISIATLCEEGAEIEAEKPTRRIITLLQCITVMFLYTAYTVCIVALLQSTTDSIQTLKDLYESGMEVGAWDTPYNRHYSPIATNPVKKAIFQKRMGPSDKNFFLNMEEGMTKVHKGLFAFRTTANSYKNIADSFEEEEKCGVQEIIYFDEEFMTHTAVSKETPFKQILTIGLQKRKDKNTD